MFSVSLQRKYHFYQQNRLFDAFRMNSRNTIGRNPLMVIPLLANQDLTPMLIYEEQFCIMREQKKKHTAITGLFVIYKGVGTEEKTVG